VPDLATARLLPWHEGTVGVLGDFRLPNGEYVPLDARIVLRRLVERTRSLGFEPKIGIVYEFYLFRGDLAAVAQAGWRLEPVRSRPYT
jgi:glutamine synthetase